MISALFARFTPIREGKLAAKSVVTIGVFALAAGAIVWFIATRRINPLPQTDQIKEMHFRDSTKVTLRPIEVTIPRERWNDVLASLSPTFRRRDYNPLWAILGELKIVTLDGDEFEIFLFSGAREVRFNMRHGSTGLQCIGGSCEQLMKVVNEIESAQRPEDQSNP